MVPPMAAITAQLICVYVCRQREGGVGGGGDGGEGRAVGRSGGKEGRRACVRACGRVRQDHCSLRVFSVYDTYRMICRRVPMVDATRIVYQ